MFSDDQHYRFLYKINSSLFSLTLNIQPIVKLFLQFKLGK